MGLLKDSISKKRDSGKKKKGEFQAFHRACLVCAALAPRRKGSNSEGQLCVKLLELGIYSKMETLLLLIIICVLLLLHFFKHVFNGDFSKMISCIFSWEGMEF